MSPFWQEILSRPLDLYRRLPKSQRLALLGVAAVGVVVVTIGGLMASRPSYRMLYGGLDPQQAGAMAQTLDSEGIRYRTDGAGTMIEVASEDQARAKWLLAEAGLPVGSGVGYEIFDDYQLGLTDSLLDINRQRAMEGELERTLQWSPAIRRADVSIQLPEDSPFTRERRPASASIKIDLRRTLKEAQVQAIARLAEAAVGHGLDADRVVILDQDLNRLHPMGDPDGPDPSEQHLELAQRLESHLEEKAESQLAAVAAGLAAVRVSVQLDMTHREQASERLDDANKVKVRESIDTSSSRSPSGGDPSVAATSGDGGPVEESENVTTEYAQGVTKEFLLEQPGRISRLSVSLLLDESLADREEDLGSLVKAAVGFDPSRNDQFEARTLAFVATEEPTDETESGFALPDLLPLLGYLVEAVTVLFVLLFLRRLLRGRSPAASPVVAGAAGAVPAEELDVRSRLGRYIEERPEEARELLVAWLKDETAL